MTDKWKARLRKLWREWGKPILVVVLVLGSFKSAVADWNDVPTGSMRPTILEGDRIFANKLSYGLRLPFTDVWLLQWGGPRRGDVVICFAPDTGVRLVKRVVGVPGDVIELRDNVLYINGRPAEYGELDTDTVNQIDSVLQQNHRFAAETIDGRSHPVMLTPGRPARRQTTPVTVPADHYFVMGDNRDASRDSRFFGCVHIDDIHARSSRVVLSVDRDNYYLPRWDRFFRALP